MSDKFNDGIDLMQLASGDNNETTEVDTTDELIEIINDEHTPDVPASDEEFDKAAEIISTSEEVAAQNKAEFEELKSPLIVHKKTDASYQETASEVVMEETHVEEDGPTLTRHRFKKEKSNKHTGIKIFIALIIIACVVFAGLYYGGVINLNKNQTTIPVETVAESTTSLEDRYKGKIVIKNTYIFVDGYEVYGLEGLQDALKYEDASPTKYEIVKENADTIFLNDNVLPLLSTMGFYNENTVISTIAKTGLVAEEEKATETTTQAPTTTTEAITEE